MVVPATTTKGTHTVSVTYNGSTTVLSSTTSVSVRVN